MTLSKQPVKGARDFYPKNMRHQNYIFDTWKRVCEQFGYEQYDTPILEPTDIYLSKGNEEIVKEQTYTFEDRGGRSLTMRTEMTPSVSRLVANKRQEFGYPLRLYSIPQCWRYERMQRGRGREFYQLNVDVFGIDDDSADIEIITIADEVMQAFKAARDMYTIKINSRALTKEFFWHQLGIRDAQYEEMLRLIDKRAKIGAKEFKDLSASILSHNQVKEGAFKQIVDFLDTTDITKLPKALQDTQEAKDLTDFIDKLNEAGISNAVFAPDLMRGFDYYTDKVFEVFDTDTSNNRSMFGGGRYDGLVGMFGVQPVPTVGFGMGDITLLNFLETHDLLPDIKPATDIYLIGLHKDARQIATQLRELGVNVAEEHSSRKLDKQFKTAEKHGIAYALVVGENELKSGDFELKNLITGKKETLTLKGIADTVAL